MFHFWKLFNDWFYNKITTGNNNLYCKLLKIWNQIYKNHSIFSNKSTLKVIVETPRRLWRFRICNVIVRLFTFLNFLISNLVRSVCGQSTLKFPLTIHKFLYNVRFTDYNDLDNRFIMAAFYNNNRFSYRPYNVFYWIK